jgi:hypothetical protein
MRLHAVAEAGITVVESHSSIRISHSLVTIALWIVLCVPPAGSPAPKLGPGGGGAVQQAYSLRKGAVSEAVGSSPDGAKATPRGKLFEQGASWVRGVGYDLP